MATKLKGICKGSFKYISQIFVMKEEEREMEIGYPTDVKHVAHIGWDGPDGGTAPSWMNEFKTGTEMAVASMGSGGSKDATWTSQDFERTFGRQQSSAMLSNFPPTNLPSIPKKQKQKRKKAKSSTPSPKSNSNSTRSSRSSKSKSTLGETEENGSRHSVNL